MLNLPLFSQNYYNALQKKIPPVAAVSAVRTRMFEEEKTL